MEPQETARDGEEEHAARRREEILAAAATVFDANGYAQTTMDAVAAEAGVAKGSLYNYFPSKHDLFTEVFRAGLAEDEEVAEAVLLEPVSAGEKLNKYIDNWFSRLEHYRRIGGLILEFWANAARDTRRGDMSGMFQEIYARWRGRIAAIIQEGVASGEFREDIDVKAGAVLISSLLDGLTIHVIMNVGLAIDEELLGAIKRAVGFALTVGADTEREETRDQA